MQIAGTSAGAAVTVKMHQSGRSRRSPVSTRGEIVARRDIADQAGLDSVIDLAKWGLGRTATETGIGGPLGWPRSSLPSLHVFGNDRTELGERPASAGQSGYPSGRTPSRSPDSGIERHPVLDVEAGVRRGLGHEATSS